MMMGPMPVGAAPSMHHRAPGPSGAPSSTRRPGGKAPALAPAPAAPPLRIRGPGGSLRARQPTRGGSQRRGGSNEDDEHDDGGESADERVSDEEEFYGAPQRKRPSDRTESLVDMLNSEPPWFAAEQARLQQQQEQEALNAKKPRATLQKAVRARLGSGGQQPMRHAMGITSSTSVDTKGSGSSGSSDATSEDNGPLSLLRRLGSGAPVRLPSNASTSTVRTADNVASSLANSANHAGSSSSSSLPSTVGSGGTLQDPQRRLRSKDAAGEHATRSELRELTQFFHEGPPPGAQPPHEAHGRASRYVPPPHEPTPPLTSASSYASSIPPPSLASSQQHQHIPAHLLHQHPPRTPSLASVATSQVSSSMLAPRLSITNSIDSFNTRRTTSSTITTGSSSRGGAPSSATSASLIGSPTSSSGEDVPLRKVRFEQPDPAEASWSQLDPFSSPDASAAPVASAISFGAYGNTVLQRAAAIETPIANAFTYSTVSTGAPASPPTGTQSSRRKGGDTGPGRGGAQRSPTATGIAVPSDFSPTGRQDDTFPRPPPKAYPVFGEPRWPPASSIIERQQQLIRQQQNGWRRGSEPAVKSSGPPPAVGVRRGSEPHAPMYASAQRYAQRPVSTPPPPPSKAAPSPPRGLVVEEHEEELLSHTLDEEDEDELDEGDVPGSRLARQADELAVRLRSSSSNGMRPTSMADSDGGRTDYSLESAIDPPMTPRPASQVFMSLGMVAGGAPPLSPEQRERAAQLGAGNEQPGHTRLTTQPLHDATAEDNVTPTLGSSKQLEARAISPPDADLKQTTLTIPKHIQAEAMALLSDPVALALAYLRRDDLAGDRNALGGGDAALLILRPALVRLHGNLRDSLELVERALGRLDASTTSVKHAAKYDETLRPEDVPLPETDTESEGCGEDDN